MKASAFIFIIILGYALKRKGLFKPSDFSLISRIVLNITLPCAVISNFNKLSIETSLLLLVVVGVVCNLIMISTGYLISDRNNHKEKAFNMINLSGYNIGCFTMPYVQGFLGPVGVVATCLFDAGNSFLCTGGTYSLASAVLNTGEKTTIKAFMKRLFSSVTMVTYLTMLILSILHITLPAVVTTFTGVVGAANGFLAMFMIGLGFELNFQRAEIGQILRTIAIRYGFAAMFALAFYFLLPLPLEVRAVLVLIAFAPVSSICTAFTEKCGGNVALASAINSASIIISICLMTGILLYLHMA